MSTQLSKKVFSNTKDLHENLQKIIATISSWIPKNTLNPNIFVSKLTNYVDNLSPNQRKLILQADRKSLYHAIKQAAMLGINIGSNESFLVPYNGKIQFQLGYKGMEKIAYRHGIKQIETTVLRDTDKFTLKLGISPSFEFEPNFKESGNIIGCVSLARLENGCIFLNHITKENIDTAKNNSSSYAYAEKETKDSIWHKFPEAMVEKTSIRALCKKLPNLDDTLSTLVELNDKFEFQNVTPNTLTKEDEEILCLEEDEEILNLKEDENTKTKDLIEQL